MAIRNINRDIGINRRTAMTGDMAAIGEMAGMEAMAMGITPPAACIIPCTGSKDGVRTLAMRPAVPALYGVIKDIAESSKAGRQIQ